VILLTGPNTPFGRLAVATALELGIDVDVRIINVFEAEFLDAINPLRQIPTLLFDDGRMLCDSRVICGYLCSLRPERRLAPIDNHWEMQTRCWLALGLMEAAVGHVTERLRPPRQQSAAWLQKCYRRVRNTVARLEEHSAELCQPEGRIDRLAAAIALEYIDFRLSDDWREYAPKLARWLETETNRPSLKACRPRERLPTDPVTLT